MRHVCRQWLPAVGGGESPPLVMLSDPVPAVMQEAGDRILLSVQTAQAYRLNFGCPSRGLHNNDQDHCHDSTLIPPPDLQLSLHAASDVKYRGIGGAFVVPQALGRLVNPRSAKVYFAPWGSS